MTDTNNGLGAYTAETLVIVPGPGLTEAELPVCIKLGFSLSG